MLSLERIGRHTDERLAMEKDDMPPPVPERVANPRTREDRALHEFHSNSDKMHRATPDSVPIWRRR